MTDNQRIKVNKYRVRKIRDKFLITLDPGSWMVVTEAEFRQIQRNIISKDLKRKYEDNGFLLTPKGMISTALQYERRYHFLNYPPALHIIVPTLRCNLNCDYCHSKAKKSSSKEYDMNRETAEKTVDFILNTKSKDITIEFQGGEPLLNFEAIKHIVEYSKRKNEEKEDPKQKNIGYLIVSNLSNLNDDIINFIVKHKIRITTSLDGPRELHDKHRRCGIEGSHSKVIEKVKKLREQEINVGMLMTTTKDSLIYHKEIIDEYIKHKQNIIQLKPINWIGNAEKSERYTPEEFIEFWKKSLNYIIELNRGGVDIKERITIVLLQKILTGVDPNFLDIRSPCGAVIGQVLYNYNGDIYCCDDGKIFDIFRIGSVFKDKFNEIVRKNSVKALISSSINSQYLCDACAYKPYCGTCPVTNYAEEGTVIPKLYKNFRCKIRKAQFDYLFDIIINQPEKFQVLKNWIS